MNIKNIFLFNAVKGDKITVDGRAIDTNRINDPDNIREFNGLRVLFLENMEDALRQGITERIDALFLDTDNLRDTGNNVFKLLGRAKPVTVNVTTKAKADKPSRARMITNAVKHIIGVGGQSRTMA